MNSPPPDPENLSVNDIDRWFGRAAQRQNRAVSLNAMLLTGRLFSYFGYRLRFSLLMTSVRFVAHAIEFFILLNSLGGLATLVVMVLRIGSVIVGGGWWGILEVMRERIRGFARAGERAESEREIGRWLVLAGLLSLAVTVVAAILIPYLYPADGDRIPQLYAFLIVFELAINFPVRVLHSGIFATRRVFRPLWSLFVPLIVQVSVLGAGFYLYPTAAIIIAIIASNAIGIYFTVHYCIEVYRLSGLRPRFGTPTLAFWRLLPRIPLWQGFTTTVSGLSLRMDGLLVLGLVGVYGTDARSFDFTAGVASWGQIDTFQFFYLVLPLLRGTFASADVFYFDFVKLRGSPILREFQLQFFRRVLWLAPLIAVFFWAQAVALGMLVLREIPFAFLLALLPFFIARSLIGTYEIRMFAEGRTGVHIAVMLFLSTLLWLVWINPDPASDLIEITAAMFTEIIVLINLQHLQDRRQLPLPPLLALGDWVGALGSEPGALQVGRITVPDSITSRQKTATLRLMQQKYSGNGHFAYASNTNIVYYQRTASREVPLHLELQQLTGGAVSRARLLATTPEDGLRALSALSSERWIPSTDATSTTTLTDLRSEFVALFPAGVALNIETLDGAKGMRELEHEVLARALPTASACLEQGTTSVCLNNRWITPIFRSGTLRMLFVAPAGADAADVKCWLGKARTWQMANHSG